ncbi:MAG TPA: gamma-glutamyltransferase [Alphaproteobacteria bacterium]|nr:gamma-glutamyltransferase [Alphaproteobacteria bacterium]
MRGMIMAIGGKGKFALSSRLDLGFSVGSAAMQRIMFSALMAVAVVIMQAQAAGLPRKHMIASSHPLATEAGAQVLKRGGSALDAAIAAQLVMGLVEPQSSGIGGGAFLLHWDAKVKKVESYDGRETAPLAAGPDLFLGPDGKPMPFMMTVVGGKSVGVPGVMAMLEMAHREHGALPWASLFAPAIALAENGFPVSERLAAAIAADPAIAMIPETAAYFRPNGVALKAGDIVVNKAYAQSLIALRDQGAKALVEGPLAQAIIETVRTAPLNPGGMTLGDLASYRPIKREPVCGTYRKHRICSMGLPSSGAVTMLQTLAFLERHRLAVLPPGGAQEVHLYGEASRLAYADRDAYLGDPEAMTVAVKDMLAPGYLTARGALIRRDQALPEVQPGAPGAVPARKRAMLDYSRPSTAHVSVKDAAGNAVALTTTVEGLFGSHLMAGGFILNNQLTDFSFSPVRDGLPHPNAPGPQKRPLSAMSPSLVFAPNGSLKAIVGSPGGWRIITYVTRTIMGLIDWRMDAKSAVALIHVTGRNKTLEVEAGRAEPALIEALTAKGHTVKSQEMMSGLNIIRLAPEGLDGAADPRREGSVWGE